MSHTPQNSTNTILFLEYSRASTSHAPWGAPGLDPLPPPPSLLEFGPRVPDHGRQRRPEENLLDLVEADKMGFHPMCLYSKCSDFSGDLNIG